MSETDKLVERLEQVVDDFPPTVAFAACDVSLISEAASALRSAEARIRELEASLLASMGGKDDLQTISNPQCADQAGRSPSANVSGAGWRGIESAPRDGRIVLLWSWAWAGTWGVQAGYFDGHRWQTDEGEVGDDEWENPGDDEWADDDGPVNLGPTHWMPLPLPPAESDLSGRTGSEAYTAEGNAGLDEQSSPANVSGEGEP